jgi:hypothetical protein
LFDQQADTNSPLQFQKSSQLIIRVHNEALSGAVSVNNKDVSAL